MTCRGLILSMTTLSAVLLFLVVALSRPVSAMDRFPSALRPHADQIDAAFRPKRVADVVSDIMKNMNGTLASFFFLTIEKGEESSVSDM